MNSNQPHSELEFGLPIPVPSMTIVTSSTSPKRQYVFQDFQWLGSICLAQKKHYFLTTYLGWYQCIQNFPLSNCHLIRCGYQGEDADSLISEPHCRCRIFKFNFFTYVFRCFTLLYLNVTLFTRYVTYGTLFITLRASSYTSVEISRTEWNL